MKPLTALLLTVLLMAFCSQEVFAQRLKWKRSKPETLYARNKKKKVSPIYIGIGTKTPTAQLHTIGTVRFEGLTINNALNSVVAVDGNGNLFWRDISSANANAWFLTGNSISASNFLGTTNNQDLRIRTNNNQRAVVTSSGLLGLGVAAPTAQLHSNGSVRFEGLVSNAAANRILSMDDNGNLSWRDVAGLAGNTGWLLTGNNATASSFLGTIGNEDLRIRTNNIQRVVISSSGSVGLGVSTPSAQLHTNSTVRFEGITNNNALQRLALFDNNGNLFYRDLTSLQSNFWSLTGNSGTNPSTHFLGTTDNNRLVFRTNNSEKMTITSTGKVGIGIADPLASLHVSGGPGNITAFPYEAGVFERNGDTKLAVLSSDNTGIGGASLTLGHSVFNTGGLFAGYEMQYGFNNQRYLRFNYLPRNGSGVVQNEVANILVMTDNSRVGINLGPTGGGSIPVFPTANFHTKGTIRMEGLQNGNGNPLVADANGNIFISSNANVNAWNLTGNAGTNPVSNFVGTTDNNRLIFRTNNTEKMTILPDGKVGIGESAPARSLTINSSIPDSHLGLNGTSPSVAFQGPLGPDNAGRIGYATINNNFVQGSIPGDFIVQSLSATASLIFGTTGGGAGNGVERARINASGFFGIATAAPTATLHTNGTVRFQNLPTGTGNALVMDANGNVFRSSTLTGRAERDLQAEIDDLKKEMEALKSVINSMKSGQLIVNETDNAVLFQNTPNPFSSSTSIRYYLPEKFQTAFIQISNLQGTVLRNYPASAAGQQSVLISGGELSAGTYFYSLFIDNRKVDSKKMILTR